MNPPAPHTTAVFMRRDIVRRPGSDAELRRLPRPERPAAAQLPRTDTHAEQARHRHLQQHPAVTETADLGRAVRPGAIADRHVDDAKSEDARGEEELVVAEGV